MPPVMSERPPVAEEVEHVEIRHGERVVDPYRWMRDDDRKNPKIIAYLEKRFQHWRQGRKERMKE